jgi:hypothetical protein
MNLLATIIASNIVIGALVGATLGLALLFLK